MNAVLFDLAYKHLDQAWRDGALPVAMLTEFQSDWRAEESRWSDHVVKTVAAESAANKALISEWASRWIGRSIEAAQPLAEALGVLGAAAKSAGDAAKARARSLGLNI